MLMVEIYENKFHTYFLLYHGAEAFPLILSAISYVITTLAEVRTTVLFPAAHPYCFLCANSSAHLACSKHIRE